VNPVPRGFTVKIFDTLVSSSMTIVYTIIGKGPEDWMEIEEPVEDACVGSQHVYLNV
jgi:hypothetical protein